MDFYEDNHVLHSPYQVMAVQLAAGEKPPFADSVRKSAKRATEPFHIDTDGLQGRTFPLPISSGNYFFLQAAKGKVLWCAIPRYTDSENREIFKPGNASKWELHLFEMDQKKESVFSDKIREFKLSTNGEHLLVRRDDAHPEHLCEQPEAEFSRPVAFDRKGLLGRARKVAPLRFEDTFHRLRNVDVNLHEPCSGPRRFPTDAAASTLFIAEAAAKSTPNRRSCPAECCPLQTHRRIHSP